jgi:hypothetical protein
MVFFINVNIIPIRLLDRLIHPIAKKIIVYDLI